MSKDDIDALIAAARSGDALGLLRVAGSMPGHLDDWNCNCHGSEGGVDWCQPEEARDPAMAARAADMRSGAYAARVRADYLDSLDH